MGPLEQALRNAESPPEHKAAVQYFLRVFIIYESFYPMEAFLEMPLGSTGQLYEEQGEEVGGGLPYASTFPICLSHLPKYLHSPLSPLIIPLPRGHLSSACSSRCFETSCLAVSGVGLFLHGSRCCREEYVYKPCDAFG